MGLYGEKKDYEEAVKSNIEKAKLLFSLSEKDKKKVNLLLMKKDKIIEKNKIFADFKIRQINKKISKICSKKEN